MSVHCIDRQGKIASGNFNPMVFYKLPNKLLPDGSASHAAYGFELFVKETGTSRRLSQASVFVDKEMGIFPGFWPQFKVISKGIRGQGVKAYSEMPPCADIKLEL